MLMVAHALGCVSTAGSHFKHARRPCEAAECPSLLQVFVPSDSIGAEAIVGAGICIASTDLLFNDRTVEQVYTNLASVAGHLLWRMCSQALCLLWMLTSLLSVMCLANGSAVCNYILCETMFQTNGCHGHIGSRVLV